MNLHKRRRFAFYSYKEKTIPIQALHTINKIGCNLGNRLLMINKTIKKNTFGKLINCKKLEDCSVWNNVVIKISKHALMIKAITAGFNPAKIAFTILESRNCLKYFAMIVTMIMLGKINANRVFDTCTII